MDVRLENAVLGWDLENCDSVRVFPSDAVGEGFCITEGAGYPAWRDMSDTERMARMLLGAWRLVVNDRVPVDKVHTALMVIPEFRALLDEDFFDRALK